MPPDTPGNRDAVDEARMAVTIRPTRVHRLLHAELGEAPHWVCSNASGGISIADLLPGAVLAAGSAAASGLAWVIGYGALALGAVTILASAFLQRQTAQLKRVERTCRARLRRHECLNCGVKLHGGAGTDRYCAGCRSSVDLAEPMI